MQNKKELQPVANNVDALDALLKCKHLAWSVYNFAEKWLSSPSETHARHNRNDKTKVLAELWTCALHVVEHAHPADQFGRPEFHTVDEARTALETCKRQAQVVYDYAKPLADNDPEAKRIFDCANAVIMYSVPFQTGTFKDGRPVT